MAFSEVLAERIRLAVAHKSGLNEMKMFGGLGFLLNGNMLVGVWNDSLIVRLSHEAAADALLESHVTVFDITGRPMKGWLLVASDGIATDEELRDWIERAIAFVETLPQK
ncbi:MAG: hypothetical protein JWM11_6969 [Planctomycetaceae bacterium]|nr:hypothetical protein [Planctomycetaceae bacterium]